MEYFYKKKHSDYITLPPFAEGCGNEKGSSVMEFIYPSPGIKIFIPRDFTGELTRIVTEVVHRNASKRIFWHLDDKYLGTTRNINQIEVHTDMGNHTLTVVDEDGNRLSSPFTIIGKN